MEEAFFELPEDIYADDVMEVYGLGETFRTVFFAWTRLPGETILRRKPVACVRRPIKTFEFGKVGRMLDTARALGARLHS